MVNLLNCSALEYVDYVRNKRVFLYGLSENIIWTKAIGLTTNIVAIVDDDEELREHSMIGKIEVPVITTNELLSRIKKDDVILLSYAYQNLIDTLIIVDEIDELDGIDCFVLSVLRENLCGVTEEEIRKIKESRNTNPLIPRKIHYIWFGSKEIPDDEKLYIKGWQKLNPDFEIIRWNESNYDIEKHEWTRRAFEEGDYGSASAYARIDIVYSHGGIYFDTDVELIRPLNDFLYHNAFFAYGHANYIENGSGFGAEKNSSIVSKLLSKYNSLNIPKELTTRQQVVGLARVYSEAGLVVDGRFSCIDGVAFYPREFFSAFSPLTKETRITDNTVGVHHFAGNWDRSRRDISVLFERFRHIE